MHDSLLLLTLEKYSLTQRLYEHVFPTQHYTLFKTLIEDFMSDSKIKFTSLCIAIAGLVSDGKITAVNFNWPPIVISEIKSSFPFKVMFLNDLEAGGYGVHLCKCVNLNPTAKEEPNGNCAVIGCGTGLGEAIILEKNNKKIVIPSEGGYKDFAPRDQEQINLLQFIQYRINAEQRITHNPCQ